MAVVVGKKSKVYTHDNRMKMVAYRLLPLKADAKSHRPRGLLELKDTIQAHINKGSLLVYDGWTSTDSAARQLGYAAAPP
eukprot:7793949-Karenia_brevis.AAC.1